MALFAFAFDHFINFHFHYGSNNTLSVYMDYSKNFLFLLQFLQLNNRFLTQKNYTQNMSMFYLDKTELIYIWKQKKTCLKNV